MSMQAEPGSEPIAEAVEPMVDMAAQAAADGVDAAAETSSAATERMAAFTQDVEKVESQSYATASAETAQAFEEARSRLQEMNVPGLDTGQAMFDRMKAGTDEMSRRLNDGYGRTAQAMAEFNAKAVGAWRTNAEAAVAHWQSLAGVTSWSEIIALNTTHARQQIEAMTAQTRELTELASRIARDGADAAKSSA